MNVIPMLKVQQRLFQVGMEVQRLTRALPLSIVSSHLNQNKLECYDFDLLSQQMIDVFFWFLLAKVQYFDQQRNLIMSADLKFVATVATSGRVKLLSVV